MKYTKLGNSGLEVSKLCLGTMTFANTTTWQPWIVKEEECRAIVKKALDLGINFFDTANVYSQGESEEILGRALKDFADRDKIVVATKVFWRMHEGPNGAGLSRKAIFAQVDASLRRLGMDYIDLYIIHRWDYETPIEETMKALHDLVESGKVRYIGASAMFGYQFQQAQHVAEKNGWTKFISMQNHYNMIYREDERELVPYAVETGVGLTPYSPLAGGRLAKNPDGSETTLRQETDTMAKRKYGAFADKDGEIIKRVKELADQKGVSMTQISLAWLLAKPGVVSPIVGVTKASHLEDSVKALDVMLSEAEIKYLDELYVPHPISGARSKTDKPV